MQALREFLAKRPFIGWIVAGVCVLVAAFVIYRNSSSNSPYSVDRLGEMVTIKFSDTGEEITMPRGRFEQMLWDRPAPIDPTQGIVNPKTNQPTGFLYNKNEWEETVSRINGERAAPRE
jgi:hypothetical protein